MSGHTALPPAWAGSTGHRSCRAAAAASAAAWQMPLCCAHLRFPLGPAATADDGQLLNIVLWALAALCRHRQLIIDRGVQPVRQVRDLHQQEPQLLQGLQMGSVLQVCGFVLHVYAAW